MGRYGFDSGEIWRHSIAVATGAKMIAVLKNIADAESAYLAGLVHDSGKLILDPFIQERQNGFRAYFEKESRSFLHAERRIFGFDHAEIASKP
jgi:HD-like signal output (HDOD) protein